MKIHHETKCFMMGFLIIGFSQLKASEFFVFRKMEMLLTENHPFYGCASDVIQKSHLSLYNKVVQAYIAERKGD